MKLYGMDEWINRQRQNNMPHPQFLGNKNNPSIKCCIDIKKKKKKKNTQHLISRVKITTSGTSHIILWPFIHLPDIKKTNKIQSAYLMNKNAQNWRFKVTNHVYKHIMKVFFFDMPNIKSLERQMDQWGTNILITTSTGLK